MSPTKSVSQTIIVQPKKGSNLREYGGSPAFEKLTALVKSQPGFLQHFWGYQVENPHLFVYTINWNSDDDSTLFTKTEHYSSFTSGLDEVFDLQAAPPITLSTHFAVGDALAAHRAAVTEIAFYTFPRGLSDETKARIEGGSGSLIEDIHKIGKAQGASLGWTYRGVPGVPEENGDALCGVFGYASIEAHERWRETPEGKAYGKQDDDPAKRTTVPITTIYGVDEEKGYFHVAFQEGK